MRCNYLLHKQHVENPDGEWMLTIACVIEFLFLKLKGKHEQIITFRFQWYLLCMQFVMYVDFEDFLFEEGTFQFLDCELSRSMQSIYINAYGSNLDMLHRSETQFGHDVTFTSNIKPDKLRCPTEALID